MAIDTQPVTERLSETEPRRSRLVRAEQAGVQVLQRFSLPVLRIALGVVFIWFGALKVMGATPVADLVTAVVAVLAADQVVVGVVYKSCAAADDVRVLITGNPANTNALIAASNAEGVPVDRFTAMVRLDENRAKSQLAIKAGVPVAEVTNLAVWGNHSPTMVPDFEHALIGGKPATEVITDRDWLEGGFLTTVQQRGKAIIDARGASSAASAASALIDHVANWLGGVPTEDGDWVSMAVPSDGSYGVPEGLISGFPVVTDGAGSYTIVQGLDLSPFVQGKLERTIAELEEERTAVADML
jgi:malate dehydrogenase